MKIKNIFGRILGLAFIATLAGCQADMDTPELTAPVADIQPNTTILELKTKFFDEDQTLIPEKENGEHYIIHGRVISSDATGNIYKSLVIQDETAALAFSINQGSMYVDWRLGQDVVVDMTGLYIGFYRTLQQVGWPNSIYNGIPQLGFMAYDYWKTHAQRNGLPDDECVTVGTDAETWPADKMYCVQLTLPISVEDLERYQSQLVEIRDVHFTEGGKETYAPYQESVSRVLANESGSTIDVRNSGYSNFYNRTLPEGKGSVRGILSYYNDKWQLLLRGPEDVMIDSKGTRNDPWNVEEAIDPANRLRTGWVSGYIVGSVKAGVEDVKSAADVIFGPDGQLENNVLIADTPDCTDYTKCLIVSLPQNSALRATVNLLKNKDAYKKKLLVQGELEYFMGRPGLCDTKGKAGDFAIE